MRRFFWLVLLASWLSGCGGPTSDPGPAAGDNVAPLAPITGTTATVILRQAVLRGLPSSITDLEFWGRDSAGRVVYGPDSRARAPEIRLELPITTTLLHVSYLQNGQLVGVFTASLDLSPGATVVLKSPAFTDVSDLNVFTVKPQNVVLTAGFAHPLRAESSFAGGTVYDVAPQATWTSSAPAVATVDRVGRVTAIAPGTAVVTATFHGVKSQAQIRVTAATLTSLAVSPTDPTLKSGQSSQAFTATATYSDGTTADLTGQVAWSSSNPAVATIDADGTATGQISGTTSIQASYQGRAAGTTLTVQGSSGFVQGNRNYGSLPIITGNLATGDLDGKNGPDLVLGCAISPEVDVCFNRGDGTFDEPLVLMAPNVGGTYVQTVVLADFDGQNGLDVAVINTTDKSVGLFFEQGGGKFAPMVRLPFSGSSQQAFMATADFDGQNGPDLAVNFDGNLSLLLNQGDGTFSAPVPVPVSFSGIFVAAGELDGVNGPDLVLSSSGAVIILPNQGGGVFTPSSSVTVATAGGTQQVVVADVDGKNGNDLGVSCNHASVVTVLLAQGNLSYTRVDVPIGPSPTGLAVGDLDGKNGLDLMAANSGDPSSGLVTASVALNLGGGAWAPPVFYATGVATNAVALADFDGRDGLDAAVGQTGAAVLLNQGNGTFYPFATAPVGFPISSGVVASDDLDGANGPDAVVTGFFPSSQLAVLLNDGTGRLTSTTYKLDATAQMAVALADLDDTRGADVAVGTTKGVQVFPNLGNGTLGPPSLLPTTPPNKIVTGDFDGRNGPDIAVLLEDTTQVFFNLGDGAFGPPVNLPQPPLPPDYTEPVVGLSMTAGNLDGAPGDELIVGALAVKGIGPDQQYILSVYSPTSSTPEPPVVYPLSSSQDPIGIALGNFDGQNGLDLVVASQNASSPSAPPSPLISLFPNAGDGSFGTPLVRSIPVVPTMNPAVADMNRDGRDDLVLSASSLAISLDPLAGLQLRAYGQPANSVTVADFNRDGRPDVMTPLNQEVGVQLGLP